MFGPRRPRYGYGYSHHRGARDGYISLLLLQLAAKVYNLPYKPPVTLAIMAANFAIHFRDHVLPFELARLVPSIPEGCIQPSAVLNGQWMRLIWSAFLHLDDSHVYYNMASLLVKGLQMESQMGSKRFAALVAELLVLSHGFMAMGCYFLGENYYEFRYLSRSLCAAGFSAVLFALKWLASALGTSRQRVWGGGRLGSGGRVVPPQGARSAAMPPRPSAPIPSVEQQHQRQRQQHEGVLGGDAGAQQSGGIGVISSRTHNRLARGSGGQGEFTDDTGVFREGQGAAGTTATSTGEGLRGPSAEQLRQLRLRRFGGGQ